MTEQNPTETKAPAKVFGVYDKTFLRFVGGTHETKAKAEAAAKAAEVKSYDIRELDRR